MKLSGFLSTKSPLGVDPLPEQLYRLEASSAASCFQELRQARCELRGVWPDLSHPEGCLSPSLPPSLCPENGNLDLLLAVLKAVFMQQESLLGWRTLLFT